jgi:hypothetical protein
MRRLVSIVLSVVLVAVVSSFAFAEEKGGMMGKGMMHMQGQMMGEKGAMVKSGEMMGMCPMHTMMMKHVMGKSIVATEDGGIVIVYGNKLMKYDENLNLKKEVELKIDMDSMQKVMKGMMEKCPMRKMMGKSMMRGSEEQSKVSEASDTSSSHEAHHN